MNARNKNTPSIHHPQRWNVTTSMVGLKNGHIRKNLTQNGEPQRPSWGTHLLRCMLDGDACCPHEGGCPPQLLQVAIELVPVSVGSGHVSRLIASCSGQCCSRCSAVMMSALHGPISDLPTLNLLYMWALSLLCPVLNLNRITCSVLFSLWRLSDWL